MSFEGLQGFLKRKKQMVSATTEGEYEVTKNPAGMRSSIYFIAAREACEKHAKQKRERSPCDEPRNPVMTTETKVEEAPCTPSLHRTPTSEKASPTHLTEEEFLERCRISEDVLLQCAQGIASAVDVTTVSGSTIDKMDDDGDVVVRRHRISGLPMPLCHFLEKRLQPLSATTTLSDVFYEEKENDLIYALKPLLNQNDDAQGPVPMQLEPLVTILRTVWFLLCLHWRTALRRSTSNTSGESGWTYNAYLLSRHALPEVIKNTSGREVALTLEAWREFYRVRQDVFDFLAYMLHDVEVAAHDAYSHSSGSSDDKVEAGVRQRIVPVEIVDSLFHMVQHLRRRDFGGCRQLYADLTMGTANWKLGLFSGGEVHMRRSMERIERRRIAHLLHNQNAVRLLHALRELMDFAHKYESALESSGIFLKEC